MQQGGHTIPNKIKCCPDINTLKVLNQSISFHFTLVKVPGHMFLILILNSQFSISFCYSSAQVSDALINAD